MINSNDINSLESNINQAKELVEHCAAYNRLRSNRDFKTVISDGYFEKEAIRLVHLKGDVAMQGESAQQAIIMQMDAISALSHYFFTIGFKGASAARSITDDEETLAEMLAEGVL